MDKREFIIKGLLGAVGIYAAPSIVKANSKWGRSVHSPEIFNTFDEIKGLGTPLSLRQHYTESYLNNGHKLNNKLLKVPVHLPLRNIFIDAKQHDYETLKLAGDYYNHRLFWKSLSPSKSKQLSSELESKINLDFGSLNNLKEAICKSAEQASDKSWIWVIYQNESLKIVKTEQHTNPYFSTVQSEQQGVPLFCVDLYSHSHKAFNNKCNYCQAYFELINWAFVSKRYKKILNGKL